MQLLIRFIELKCDSLQFPSTIYLLQFSTPCSMSLMRICRKNLVCNFIKGMHICLFLLQCHTTGGQVMHFEIASRCSCKFGITEHPYHRYVPHLFYPFKFNVHHRTKSEASSCATEYD